MPHLPLSAPSQVTPHLLHTAHNSGSSATVLTTATRAMASCTCCGSSYKASRASLAQLVRGARRGRSYRRRHTGRPYRKGFDYMYLARRSRRRLSAAYTRSLTRAHGGVSRATLSVVVNYSLASDVLPSPGAP